MFFKSKKAVFILILGALIFIGSVIFISRVFSYNETITHPSLTENIAKIYNKNSDLKLTDQEIKWLKEGSIKEDTPLRWMNHFYDPNSGNGLPGYLSSKDWAQNSFFQSIEFGGNQTWQKAINSYVKGNKENAFIALGHILHLIEDATVPAHTRLDIHPLGDPYENWVKNDIGYQINFDIGIAEVNQLSSAFYDVAFYSNNYFFSEDTINENLLKNLKTKTASFDGKIIDCFLYYDDNGKEFCLVSSDKNFINPNERVYYLTGINNSDYFSLLGPKAVSYGAGVIKLFFEEVESQKQLEEQKSWWDKVKEFLFGSISSQLPIESGQENAPAQPAQETTASPEPSQTKIPSEPAQSSLKAIAPENPVEIIFRPESPGESQIQEQISKPEIPSQISEKKFKPIFPPESILEEPPIILTTTKNTEDEEEPEDEEEIEESISTSTPEVAPSISIFLSNYSITSRQFTVNWQSSSTDISSFDVERKISSGDWQNWLASTTATSTLFEVPQDRTVYYFRARATNSAGLTGDWQELSAPIYFYPVAINEIAWAGTNASTSNDEWMELFNKTDFEINLSGWQIIEVKSATTTAVSLKNIISPKSFYLIERDTSGDEEKDMTIRDIVADLTGPWGGSGLANAGENLRLVDQNNNIIDRVDCGEGCDIWNTKVKHGYRSIERINHYLASDIPGNWTFNNGSTTNGTNVDGLPINGTPKAQNSVFNLEFFYLYPAQNTTATSTLLEWTPSYINDFKEYRIVRSFDAGFGAASTTIVAATATTNFFDASLESETAYYYKISACDISDYCVFSNVASTTTSQYPFLWAEPKLISEISTSISVCDPDIVLTSDDLPGIIWESSTSTQARYVKFSKKNIDDTWSAPVNIFQDPAGYEMQILSKENRLEVLYSGWGFKQGGEIYSDVFSVRSENGIWQPAQNISQEGTNNSWAAGAIDSVMTTHIVWQGLSQSSSSPPYATAIFYRALDSSGLFLGAPEEIPGSVEGINPNIVIDSQNKLHAFWFGCVPPHCNKLFYSFNNQDGSGWSEGKIIFDGNFPSNLYGRPQILIDENNRFLLTWAQRIYEIVVAEFDGSASTTPKIIFSTGKAVSTPSLIINNSKKPYIFWSGLETPNGGIYFSYLKQNDKRQAIKTILEKPLPIMWARAVIDSQNTAHIVWGNDHQEIWYTFGKIE